LQNEIIIFEKYISNVILSIEHNIVQYYSILFNWGILNESDC